MAPLLPPSIGNRAKQPYRAPDSQSFVGEAAPAYVGERLSAAEIGRSGYFEPRAVAKLVAGVAEAGNGSTPVVIVAVRGPLVACHLLAPGHETRARAARDDLVGDTRERVGFHGGSG
jgi:hypothetical protein